MADPLIIEKTKSPPSATVPACGGVKHGWLGGALVLGGSVGTAKQGSARSRKIYVVVRRPGVFTPHAGTVSDGCDVSEIKRSGHRKRYGVIFTAPPEGSGTAQEFVRQRSVSGDLRAGRRSRPTHAEPGPTAPRTSRMDDEAEIHQVFFPSLSPRPFSVLELLQILGGDDLPLEEHFARRILERFPPRTTDS